MVFVGDNMENEKSVEECIKTVLADRDKFSLNEQFNLDYDDINAVTLITPTQTVSCFTDTEKNRFDSGDHHKKFKDVIKAIYEENIDDNDQDIKIGYMNYDYDPFPICQILIFIPKKINSSQYISLCNLNDEIIKLQKEQNNILRVFIKNDDQTLGSKMLDMSQILQELKDNKLSSIIDDNHTPKHIEKNIIGYPNKENHYNDSEFKVRKENNKAK